MKTTLAAILIFFATPALAMPICGKEKRVTCIVDGDTVWIDGEKIRLLGIDAPELRSQCAIEKRKAALATDRLRTILSDNTFTIERTGHDRYGRTLAHLRIGKTTAGQMMIEGDFARPWRGHSVDWCHD